MAKVPDPDLGRSDWGPGAAGVRQNQEQQRGQHGGAVGTTGQRFREVGRGLAGRHTDPGFSPECEEGATEDSDKGGRGLITPQVARAGGGPAKLLPGLGQQWASGSSQNAQTHVH